MKKKAIISVLSKQSIKENGNAKDDTIEVVTPGSFYKKEDTYYAVYDETEISGMEGTTTTLKINKDRLSLIRMGTTDTRMEFEEKKKNVAKYNTVYGTLELKIETKELKINLSDDGGSILVNYNMSIGGDNSQSTQLEIGIKTS